jgi:hypothetical protein
MTARAVIATDEECQMIEALIIVLPLLVLAIILLFPFVGCVGNDPELDEAKKEIEKQKGEIDDLKDQIQKEEEQDVADAAAAAGAAQAAVAAAAAAAIEAGKYHNVVLKESDLVAYWKLDETVSGTTEAIDSGPGPKQKGEYKLVQGVSFGQDGALSPTRHPDNNAVEFLGTQGYVQVAYDPLLNPPQDFSIEFWVRPPNPPEPLTAPQVIIGSYELNATGAVVRGYVVELMSGTPLNLRARVGNGNGATEISTPLTETTLNEGWHHVVLTYEGASLKRLRLYVNALDTKYDQEMSPATNTPVAYEANQTTNLRIGAGQQPNSPPDVAASFLKARLDEVSLYRKAMDGNTVQKHFLAGIAA